eukprot:967110-Rhodomonas_salina.2
MPLASPYSSLALPISAQPRAASSSQPMPPNLPGNSMPYAGSLQPQQAPMYYAPASPPRMRPAPMQEAFAPPPPGYMGYGVPNRRGSIVVQDPNRGLWSGYA